MNECSSGYVVAGTMWKIPVLLHWSFPAGGLLIALFLRAPLKESIYLCIAYTLLILLHEFAHASAARYFDLKVFAIKLSGLGGTCHTETPQSLGAALTFASAGLVAQALILAAVVIYVHFSGQPKSVVGSSFVAVFTIVNGLVLGVNLLPVKERRANLESDGYVLWRLIINHLRQRTYAYPDTSTTFSPKTKLSHLQGFVPPGFKVGIEVLNDNTTTMEFVVGTLTDNLEVPRDEAIGMMLNIHKNGGLLIPLETYERAEKIASRISDEARKKGYKLVCRPVNAQ